MAPLNLTVSRVNVVGTLPWKKDLWLKNHLVVEKETATHSSVLAWRTPGTGEPAGLSSKGRTGSDTTEATWQQQQVSYLELGY